MTPEERKQAALTSLADWRHGNEKVHELMSTTYDALLWYYDEHEPAVADAIRYGLVEAVTNIDDKGIQVHTFWQPGTTAYIIDKPVSPDVPESGS